MVAPAVAKSKPGGKSNAARLCQHGGWKHLVRADGTPFKNTGQCVRYAAHGGTPKTLAQLVCESVGGVFAPGSGNTLWYCTYTAGAAFGPLADRCFDDGGTFFGFVSGNLSGVRKDACIHA